MARYRKQKKGSGIQGTGQSPADVGTKEAGEAADYVKSGFGNVGHILTQYVLKKNIKGGKKHKQRGGKIIAAQTNEGLGGIPVGGEFCDKDIKKGGSKGSASCGGDVFKGLYGGSKNKSRRSTKMRRSRSSRKKRGASKITKKVLDGVHPCPTGESWDAIAKKCSHIDVALPVNSASSGVGGKRRKRRRTKRRTKRRKSKRRRKSRRRSRRKSRRKSRRRRR